MAKAIVIAAPSSGSGKTMVTLGILRALRNRGLKVASAKVGPDYIDPRFHEAATGRPCFNLDLWAMSDARLDGYMCHLARDADVVVVEGVMGLFDGPEIGRGSTADIAEHFALPIALTVDCSAMAQSVGAVVRGFAATAGVSHLKAIILNRVASDRHNRILRGAISGEHAVLGSVYRNKALALPARHLGLVQASERSDLDAFLENASGVIESSLDLDALIRIAEPISVSAAPRERAIALGARIAVAADTAFAFAYPHMLHDWREDGAEILPFSPLADEPPASRADAIFLPGGYPELHAGRLAANSRFLDGLRAAAKCGVLIYGECGGFMVLGDYLIDADGGRHAMAGLLPVGTSFARRQLHLGYRTLSHHGDLPFAQTLKGHEFHYSTIDRQGDGEPLFACHDATGAVLPAAGLRQGNVMGSYAHIIA